MEMVEKTMKKMRHNPVHLYVLSLKSEKSPYLLIKIERFFYFLGGDHFILLISIWFVIKVRIIY
ncbi:hypothetical protein DI392_00595 [Vibrio albus]|uniref:Uncharacterized protein n=1 Tax=Vibrio albus TaxID=2200953 RepID=A0A2U3BDE2_9VIBR|nr:hypothetical protein DI392_00595 [Vibrio albus]